MNRYPDELDRLSFTRAQKEALIERLTEERPEKTRRPSALPGRSGPGGGGLPARRRGGRGLPDQDFPRVPGDIRHRGGDGDCPIGGGHRGSNL